MIEEATIGRLLADVTLAGLVAERIFPGQLPQAYELPAVVFNVVSRVPLYADDGEVGLETYRLQIDSWGSTYTGAKAVARAVFDSLSAWMDDAGALYMTLDNERDLHEAGSNEAEYRFRVSQDYMVLNRS